MDWTTKNYAQANHPPVVKLGHAAELNAKRGELISLSAKGTTDPDGNDLKYEWFYYGEVGTFTTSNARAGQPLVINQFDQPQASFTVPNTRVMVPGTGTMHIVLAVTDTGIPALTRYERVIVNVTE